MVSFKSALPSPALRFSVWRRPGIKFLRTWVVSCCWVNHQHPNGKCLHNTISFVFSTLSPCRQIKSTIQKLQAVVCSDGRFRIMREALHRSDPPCIPYLGMYLTDLSFIEEGTPDFTPDGLLNFSKMRMVMRLIKTLLLCNLIGKFIELSCCFFFCVTLNRLLTSSGKFVTSSRRPTR